MLDMKSIDKTANLVHNNQMSLMIFQMQHSFGNNAPTFYGINVFKVREVIEGQRFPVAKSPNSHPLIEGMIQLRGSFLPVIDMPQWLGFPMDDAARERSVIIVADFSHNIVGFRVAHIHGVEEKSWDELLPAENMALGGDTRVVNQSTVKYNGNDELCYILDVEGLLSECLPEVAEKLNPKIKEPGEWKNRLLGKTILVADDSRSIRMYLANVLTQLELQYVIFENGQELIDYMDKLPNALSISVIITDLEMPIASGHTVIKFIRNDERFRKLIIGVHSSMTAENNERDARVLGADFFIGKINTEAFVNTLEKMSEKMIEQE